MRMRLNLVERLAARGRKYQELGLEHQETECWTRLGGLAGVPGDIAQEAQSRLGELHLDHGRFRRARRHLGAALSRQPGNAHFHYLMAAALEGDVRGDRPLALTHYRRAMELAPEEPQYLCGFGLLALELGDDDEEGITALRQALELAPDDPEILGQVVQGIEKRDREEAQRILCLALFRNGKDLRFRKLWTDFHFRCLHTDQNRQRHSYPEQTGPVLLPFVRPAAPETPNVRRDAPARPNRPHFHLPVSDRKHA